MDAKTIKISSENYKFLARLAAELQKEKERPVSLDEAIGEVIGKKKKTKLSSFAGMWKMSDGETEELKSSLRLGWGKWKIPSV